MDHQGVRIHRDQEGLLGGWLVSINEGGIREIYTTGGQQGEASRGRSAEGGRQREVVRGRSSEGGRPEGGRQREVVRGRQQAEEEEEGGGGGGGGGGVSVKT